MAARAKYQEIIATINPADLVYLDEMGIEDNIRPEYGWAPRGERIYGLMPGFARKRINVVAALNSGKVFGAMIYEGGFTREFFEEYLEKILIPQLRPGQILVMDNAAFHKRGRIAQLLKNFGCSVLYLPPYSPDLNPIENCWFPFKHKIKKLLAFESMTLIDAAIQILQQC